MAQINTSTPTFETSDTVEVDTATELRRLRRRVAVLEDALSSAETSLAELRKTRNAQSANGIEGTQDTQDVLPNNVHSIFAATNKLTATTARPMVLGYQQYLCDDHVITAMPGAVSAN